MKIGIIGTGRIGGALARHWVRAGHEVFMPGARLVRAFNCIPAASLANQASREPERIAIPLGGDDAEALAMAERLVRDAGFAPVVIGSLEQSRLFDLGQPLASGNSTAAEVRRALEAFD